MQYYHTFEFLSVCEYDTKYHLIEFSGYLKYNHNITLG